MSPLITFSLLNSKEFTATSDSFYSIALRDAVLICEQIEGSRFDYSNYRWIFPLTKHNQLGVALAKYGIYVNSLPLRVLATLQLQISDESNATSTKATKWTETCPPKLLNQLAEFQRRGVEFVISKNGRAIIADEMVSVCSSLYLCLPCILIIVIIYLP